MSRGLFDLELMEESTLSSSILDEPLDPSVKPDTSKKNYDETSIDVPKKKEIDEKVYNKAIDALVQTFKESMDIVASLKDVIPVTESAASDEVDLMSMSIDEN